MLQHNNIALTAMLNNSKSTSFYRASSTVPHISNTFKTSLHEYLTEHCKSMCDKELILIKFPIKLALFSFSGNNRSIRGEIMVKVIQPYICQNSVNCTVKMYTLRIRQRNKIKINP